MRMPTQDTAPESLTESEPVDAPTGIFERAKTGRAKCRACGEALQKGQVRCGEHASNPFGDGRVTYWFHPRCAAERRPDTFLAAWTASDSELDVSDDERPNQLLLRELAEFGKQHPRAARLANIEVSPSGRARCRCCRELIAKGETRIDLSIFQDGRFDPMGYLHPACLTDYVGDRVPWARLQNMCRKLEPSQCDAVMQACMASDGPAQTDAPRN